MDKIGLLRIVNPVLFCVLALQVITGLVMFFNLAFPGIPLVLIVHRYNALLLIALAATHITLNWTWIKANYFRKRI
jgi:thiosulfate reductase cytochrome b subunit